MHEVMISDPPERVKTPRPRRPYCNPTYVVVVLTLTHGYNAVRGRRTGSNTSEAEDYLRRTTNKIRR